MLPRRLPRRLRQAFAAAVRCGFIPALLLPLPQENDSLKDLLSNPVIAESKKKEVVKRLAAEASFSQVRRSCDAHWARHARRRQLEHSEGVLWALLLRKACCARSGPAGQLR